MEHLGLAELEHNPRNNRMRALSAGRPVTASKTVIVRYRTRPETAEANSRLVQAVFDSLAELKPSDFGYTTYRLADGVSFVHVAQLRGTGNPLAALPAFAEFQLDLAQRCVEQPAPSEATIVGSYASTG
jgi:hypothetical protein